MNRFFEQSAAAIAAIFIVVVSWAPLVTVPPAQAATLITPILA